MTESVSESVTGSPIELFWTAKNIYIKKFTFPDPAPEGRTETLLVTYIPQMLAENIQYKKYIKKCTLGLTETLQVMCIP